MRGGRFVRHRRSISGANGIGRNRGRLSDVVVEPVVRTIGWGRADPARLFATLAPRCSRNGALGTVPNAFETSPPGALDAPTVHVGSDPGNFTGTQDLCRWGPNMVPAVHGFGGVTGRVTVRATDAVRIDDVYVENKPSVTDADVVVSVGNGAGRTVAGKLRVRVCEWRNPGAVIFDRTLSASVPAGGKAFTVKVHAPKAKPWAIRDPHLYTASVSFASSDGSSSDTVDRRFGFRYFTVGEKNGDRRFYLNGRRVFIFAAMTRGFWPATGMNPTAETARRDIDITSPGYNMMLFPRIGSRIIDLCDEAGSSSTRNPPATAASRSRTRSDDMAARKAPADDPPRRSNPSFIIYNLKNSDRAARRRHREVRMIQSLDPGGWYFTSHISNVRNYWENRTPDPSKLHALPFDDSLRTSGWFDQHHGRYPGYVDECYRNPLLRPRLHHRPDRHRARRSSRAPVGEIVFWGEEGRGAP